MWRTGLERPRRLLLVRLLGGLGRGRRPLRLARLVRRLGLHLGLCSLSRGRLRRLGHHLGLGHVGARRLGRLEVRLAELFAELLALRLCRRRPRRLRLRLFRGGALCDRLRLRLRLRLLLQPRLHCLGLGSRLESEALVLRDVHDLPLLGLLQGKLLVNRQDEVGSNIGQVLVAELQRDRITGQGERESEAATAPAFGQMRLVTTTRLHGHGRVSARAEVSEDEPERHVA